MATVDKGDVILPNPAYPIHPFGFVISGADIRHVPIGPNINFFDNLEEAQNFIPETKNAFIKFPK